ncbi:MAG TPA: PBP1A family penicillin-binding protein [Thermoanaerobaculia bacterium]|nr:PBP1A family penicillin-binding protein [Thermoanaerobaculia bacterium]
MRRKRGEGAAKRQPAKRRSASRSRAGGGAPKRPRRRSSRPGWARWALYGVGALAIAGVVALTWLVWPSWRAAESLSSRDWTRPSLVYGRPARVARGERLAPDDLVERLRALGYRRSSQSPIPTGSYRAGDDRVDVALRSFPTAKGPSEQQQLRVRFDGGRIKGMSLGGGEVASAPLDPPLLGLLVGDDLRDRRPVRRAELPEHVVRAVLAAEDATFFEHRGISLQSLLRATWINLKSGEVQQGGSTLTQQLVKNLYLTPERTLLRKIREGVLSLLVEMRFDKEEILEAYLNEAYWGRARGVSLMGMGAAARAWFGCDARELDTAEAALLAGMLRSPGSLDPARHPEASRARRDEVLARMHELGWLDDEAWRAFTADPPVLYQPRFTPRTRAYFLDALAREARRRFALEELRSRGYTLLTTLDPADQSAAEKTLAEGLAHGEESGAEAGLQGALLSLDPESGGILAWVGGRSYQDSQFDRVELARRQPGSAFKPVIFTAAFAAGVATPSTLLDDVPLTLEVGGKVWEPQNVDHQFHGWVTARRALEDSINVATIRLGERTGWERVVATARELGIDAPLQAVPSLGLGSIEVAPLRLATVYATLASGGWRTEPHLLRAVLDGSGKPLEGNALQRPRQVISPEVAFQVSYLLQGVLDSGTAASARSMGVTDALAGKTGTTNSARDSWFVGFSPERATLVWVGYDDNRGTRLSGNRAALPIWSRFVLARRPPGGYRPIEAPAKIQFIEVDPETGGYAGRRCPHVTTEAFLEGTRPETDCYLHAGGRRPRAQASEEEDWRAGRRPWWRRRVLKPRQEEDEPRQQEPRQQEPRRRRRDLAPPPPEQARDRRHLPNPTAVPEGPR